MENKKQMKTIEDNIFDKAEPYKICRTTKLKISDKTIRQMIQRYNQIGTFTIEPKELNKAFNSNAETPSMATNLAKLANSTPLAKEQKLVIYIGKVKKGKCQSYKINIKKQEESEQQPQDDRAP